MSIMSQLIKEKEGKNLSNEDNQKIKKKKTSALGYRPYQAQWEEEAIAGRIPAALENLGKTCNCT